MQATAGSCACSSGYTEVNSRVCLHSQTTAELQTLYPSSTAFVVEYPDVESAGTAITSSLTSAVISEWFYEAGVKCTRQVDEAGVAWCQMVANMCVLQMYKRPACLLYTSDAADDLLCVDLGGRRFT
eukprot:TRINITY_DN24591_c0_g1_i1.p1 TRINITY_DN24591_c0_g1~~TRINITY_DN24591_c0_g1_i1.p1  ORF type:complete len:127 (+),score=42.35 TRINITY_DN24591_c0_g1_i1:282-662(+)